MNKNKKDKKTKKDEKIAAQEAMTPREYCAYSRNPAFWRVKQAEGSPAWTKIGHGLIAVTDGSKQGYIAPGLVFGVEPDADGRPVIASYWAKPGPSGGLAAMRPYTLHTCKTMSGKLAVRQMPIEYREMIRMVRSVHPFAWVPSEAEFLAEYGL